MPTIRQDKASALIKRELSLIFQQQSRRMFAGIMVTVTNARMSPDLGVAKVYLSFFPATKKTDGLRTVEGRSQAIRGMLGSVVGKQLRVVPELQFFLDDSLDYYEQIDKLLKKP